MARQDETNVVFFVVVGVKCLSIKGENYSPRRRRKWRRPAAAAVGCWCDKMLKIKENILGTRHYVVVLLRQTHRKKTHTLDLQRFDTKIVSGSQTALIWFLDDDIGCWTDEDNSCWHLVFFLSKSRCCSLKKKKKSHAQIAHCEKCPGENRIQFKMSHLFRPFFVCSFPIEHCVEFFFPLFFFFIQILHSISIFSHTVRKMKKLFFKYIFEIVKLLVAALS